MNCPSCAGTMSIIANRARKLQPVVWRRRRCVQCSKVVTTYETIEAAAHQQDSALSQLDEAVASFVAVVDQVRWRLAVEQQVEVSEERGGQWASINPVSTVIHRLGMGCGWRAV